MYTHKQLKAEEDGLEPSGLSISECVELILKITATTSVTLVIDALDECCSRTRHELFSVLKRIVAESHNVAKILVSSRQDSDIDAHFDCQEQIRVTEDQTHGDLNRFIEAQVTAAVQGRRILPGQEISPALHKSIVEGLKSKAHGMFQWISLQIENLCDSGRLKREEDVHRAIAGLPKSLSKSYDMILRRVREMECTSCKTALHTFMWLLGAKRLLSTHELLAAVSWSVLQRPDGISKRDVLRCCLNLVTADLSLDTFRFSHPSVFEYLKAGRESHGLPHEDLLLTTCLRTLFNHKSKALRSYSTTYWGSHLDTSSKATCLPVESRGLFETFLVEDEHLEVWLDDLDALLETESYLHGELVRKLRSVRSTPVSPLFAISCFGIDCYWLRCTRIREKVSRWDQLNSRGASALYLAACWGVCDLVQLLIDQKVDVNIAGGRFGSALQVAAHNGHREVVRLLLRHGAEPRGSEYFPDPMSAAVAGGHGNIVRFMLGNGLHFTDRQSFAACRDLALFDGQAELVRFLLDRFPEHFEPEEHEDQLQAALYARKEKMVRELIDGQIDVEKQTGPFGNALQAAICGGKLDLVELIINSGADLNC
ncbi:hypothetical protein D6D26_09088 [Aureobasidium pullulans]|nr:hypothetical protein D6D26_09088 [Aureobasidium pullulans]